MDINDDLSFPFDEEKTAALHWLSVHQHKGMKYRDILLVSFMCDMLSLCIQEMPITGLDYRDYFRRERQRTAIADHYMTEEEAKQYLSPLELHIFHRVTRGKTSSTYKLLHINLFIKSWHETLLLLGKTEEEIGIIRKEAARECYLDQATKEK